MIEHPNRNIYLFGVIDEEKIMQTIESIHLVNDFDSRTNGKHKATINIWLMTIGGDSCAGLALCDIIRTSSTPVCVIATGKCYSIGIVILASAELRCATKYTTFMIHQGSTEVGGNIEDVEESIAFSKIIEKFCDEVVTNNTPIKQKFLSNIYKKREEYNFTVKEAFEIGLIKGIL